MVFTQLFLLCEKVSQPLEYGGLSKEREMLIACVLAA